MKSAEKLFNDSLKGKTTTQTTEVEGSEEMTLASGKLESLNNIEPAAGATGDAASEEACAVDAAAFSGEQAADKADSFAKTEKVEQDVNAELVPTQDALESFLEQAKQAAKVEPASGADAQRVAAIEPAAGDAGTQGALASRGGFGFQSETDFSPVNAIGAIGALNETELQYDLPEFNEDQYILDVDFTVSPNVEVVSASTYEDTAVAVNMSVSPETTGGDITVVISDIPAGWTVSDELYDSTGTTVIGTGAFDAAAGTWTISFTNGQGFNGGPIFTPPADSDVDAFDVTVTVSENVPSTGQSGSSSAQFDVVVDAVADQPEIDAQDDSGAEGTALDIDVSALTGEEVNNGAGADDGSETITHYEVAGVPAGFTLSAGIETAPGSGVYEIAPADIAGLQIAPTDPNFAGSVNLSVTVYTTEAPVTDGEFDLTNNDEQATDNLTLTWTPVADQPTLSVDNALVKEDGSVFVPVEANLTDTDGSEFLTVTVTGVPASWNFSGTNWVQTGPETYEIVLAPGANYNDGFTLTPPADSDIDLTGLQVTATSTEVANNDTSSIVETIDVIVDAVADDASVNGDDESGAKNAALDVDITGSAGDTDGSETVVKYQISDVPTGFTFNQGTDLGGGVWEFTPAQLAGLEVTPPTDFVGDIDLTVTIFTTENPVDGEPDTSDNTNTATDTFTLTWKPVATPPSVKVNGGVDDAIVKEDGSVDVPITANLSPAGSGNEILTVTVEGIDASWGFSAPIGTYDAAAGTWMVTLPAGQNLSSVMTFTPPADSDIDLTGLTASVSAYEPATGTTANGADDDFNVIVDAVADNPDIDAQDDSGSEGTALDVDLSALTGEEVNNGAGADDGSETIVKYQIEGIPAGFTPSAGTDLGGGVWEFTPAEIVNLTITPNDPNYSGSINLVATVFTTENTVDGETDTSDNLNQAIDAFKLTWTPVINPPSVKVNGGVDDVVVKEDGSVDVPITANLGANAASGEYLTVTVEGIDPTWNFSAPVGTYDAAAGTWTVTLPAGQNLSSVMTFTPPADSDIDLTGLKATVVATDPATAQTADATDTFNVIVDAVADDASVNGNDESGAKNAALDVDITGSAGDTDGSETVVKYQISDVPTGFTFNQGADLGGGVWEFTPAQLSGLEVTPPTDFVGDIDLTVTIFTTENPVDGEPDTSDNTDTATDIFTLTWKPTATPPSVKVNGGVDDAIVKEDGSVDVPITANLSPAGSGNEILTVTVEGIDASWGFSAPIGTYDAAAGTWTVTLPAGQNLSSVMTFTPPADSDIDLTGLTAKVSAYEPVTGTTANGADDDFNVIVDAVADTPNLDANNASGEEGNLIALNITTSVNDTDTSETIEVIKIGGLPTGATLNKGTYDAVEGVWKLSPSDLSGLGINVPNGSVGTYTLSVESVAYESNLGGSEVDYTDNRASAFDTITLTIGQDEVPTVEDDEVTIDETTMDTIPSVSGTVDADFGGDAPGSFKGNGTFFIGDLKSGGNTVTVTFDAATNTYTGKAAGNDVFTFKIETNGEYTFTLLQAIDHPDATDHDDSLALDFGVTATDSDGDPANAVVTVNVKDDGPTITNKAKPIDEAGLANGNPISYTHTISHDFGEDGAGTIEPTGTFMATFQVGGAAQQLQSNNVDITVTQTANGYIGVAGGETVFKLVMNGTTGQYTYTQFKGIDHPDATNPDDVIWLKFEMQIVDADGDTDTAFVIVDVRDHGPVAHDDVTDCDPAVAPVTGNVTDNDDLSGDAPNTITKISFEGTTIDIPTDGSYAEIVGDNGTLRINMSGDYSYEAFDSAFSGGSSILNPVSMDADGQQTSISRDGITVSVVNAGNFDISWVSTSDGNGLGIDNLDSGDSKKVWPQGEAFDVAFDKTAETVTLTIGELGSNSNYGQHGIDYIVTLEDGTTVAGEQQFVPSEINGGLFTFSLDAADFGGKLIQSIELDSTNDGAYKGASWLLNNVVADYPDAGCVGDSFTYTLSDADGDTDTATLTVKTHAVDPLLVVGQNVSDDSFSTTPHLIGGTDGVIEGASGSDILVGDTGGSTLVKQTQDYNFVFILDVSGSMGTADTVGTKLALLNAAVKNLIADIESYQSGEIKVHVIPFSTSAKPAGTFTITDAGQVAALEAYIDAMPEGGFTNYEDPMQAAIEWLSGSEPLGGDAVTTTYFVSDGAPNRHMDDSGNVVTSNASTAMAHITGAADGTDEIAQLQALSDEVIGVGIDIGGNIVNIDMIDSDGTALNIDDPTELNLKLSETNPLLRLAATGDDVLEGGAGDDIMYGDVIYTDTLASDHGFTLEDGAGWEVFERLENGESALDPSWSRADTISYIRDNAVTLSGETLDNQGGARLGGDDILNGGAGDDLIFGQEGDDVINGGAGNDNLYGGSGADTFVFDSITDGLDTIHDFDAAEGDVIDLSALLSGYDALSDDIADFVIATENGGNTTISVDQTGNSGASELVQVALLDGVVALDLDASLKTEV